MRFIFIFPSFIQDEIEAQKKEWELEHLKSLKAEEERATSHSEPDELLTIWNEDASQVKNRSRQSLKSKCKPIISSPATKRTPRSTRPSPVASTATVRRSAGKLRPDTQTPSRIRSSPVQATKRSYRNRPSLNYAKIVQGADLDGVHTQVVSPRSSARSASNTAPQSPASSLPAAVGSGASTPTKRRSIRTPVRSLRRSRRTSD